jgi:3-oxoacyl-[acyl-carrier protein] reductase
MKGKTKNMTKDTTKGEAEDASKSATLKGKNALVTGASRNLGAVTALALARCGSNVIINDIDSTQSRVEAEKLLKTLGELEVKALFIPADVTRSSEVHSLCRRSLDALGKIDIVVNNAGPFNAQPFLELEEKTWDSIMDANLKAVYLTTRELAPLMKSHGWGRIVTMCAGSAYVRNHGVYGLAKAAVQVLTESLALELGPEITVNSVAPGQIAESLPDIQRIDPTFGERYTARAPLKRLVTREEVARLIALLCSPAFDSMTGVVMRFDGGAEIPRF